ncbi:MAG: hypothetical protein IJ123_00455 [Blautia sp.]|nr:hypothetical protein [Blautia sp.]
MNRRNRSDYLLIEILIAVFFLMVTLTVLVRVFSLSRSMAIRSQVETEALYEAQNIAENMYGSEHPEELLDDMYFVSSHGYWTKNMGAYSLMITGSFLPQEAGQLWEGSISAYVSEMTEGHGRQEGVELFRLPVSWYRGV